MKKILLTLALGFGAMGISSGTAHADLVTYWNFNDATTVVAAGDTAAQATLVGQIFSSDGGAQNSTISTNFGVTANDIKVFGGSTINANGSDGAGNAMALLGGTQTGTGASATYANNGKYIQFTVNNTNYYDTKISFAAQRTTTGFNSDILSYSTDGVNFTDFNPTTPYVPPASFALQTFDLSSIDAIEGASSVTYRLTLAGASSAAGNNRIDNIQVNATATPEPATWAMMALGVFALGVLQFRRKRRDGSETLASDLAI